MTQAEQRVREIGREVAGEWLTARGVDLSYEPSVIEAEGYADLRDLLVDFFEEHA